MRGLRRSEASSSQPALPLASELGDVRYRQALSADDWASLPEAIRRRFSHRSAPGESLIYAGYVLETRMSWVGFVLAHLLRIIGSPLPIGRDYAGAASVVVVTERPDGEGQFWTREYVRRSGFPQVIHSTKRFAGETGVEETVGFGFTMSLRLEVRPGALFFLSRRYFLRAAGRRLPIPGRWLLGDIAVGHTDRGDGAFEFSLDVVHPWFGLILRQRALFRDVPANEVRFR
jgi:hypothetical protein